jgi:hypothetical protein
MLHLLKKHLHDLYHKGSSAFFIDLNWQSSIIETPQLVDNMMQSSI